MRDAHLKAMKFPRLVDPNIKINNKICRQLKTEEF